MQIHYSVCTSPATFFQQLQATYDIGGSRAQRARNLERVVLLVFQDGVESCQFHLDANFEEIVEALRIELENKTR